MRKLSNLSIRFQWDTSKIENLVIRKFRIQYQFISMNTKKNSLLKRLKL